MSSRTRTATAPCRVSAARNAELGVTWIHSYVTRDKSRTFCVYDAPDAATIRKAAEANGLPVDNITEVRVLDPYFYYLSSLLGRQAD